MLLSHSTTVGNTATAESRNHRSPRVSSHNQSFGLLQCGAVRFPSGRVAATIAGYERRCAFSAQLTTARPHHGGFAPATLASGAAAHFIQDLSAGAPVTHWPSAVLSA
jgi:hypothetical protein